MIFFGSDVLQTYFNIPCDVYSDILSGHLYGIRFDLTFDLAFFVAFDLEFYLAFHLAPYLAVCSGEAQSARAGTQRATSRRPLSGLAPGTVKGVEKKSHHNDLEV